MAAVTSIREFSARETGEVLRELLDLHAAGRLTGFAFACKLGPKTHGIGITDDYRRDPAQVLAVTARIDYRVNQIIDHRES
jgi:hypothetical protein